jgi:hypothetical protein
MKPGLHNLWPTTILIETVDVAEAAQTILATCDLRNPPKEDKNFDILRDVPGLKNFRDNVVIPTFAVYLKEVFNLEIEQMEYSLRSWLAGISGGYMIPVHNHSGAMVSAVFYLMCDEVGAGGELYLIDPRANANRGYTDSLRKIFAPELYTPKSGEAIVFPSFLYHQTLPFTGKMRLAMPVDLFITE